MIAQYASILFILVLLVVLTNFLRFRCNDTLNKWILIASSFIFIELQGYMFDFQYTAWMPLLLIVISLLSFGVLGGVVSICVAWLITYVQCGETDLSIGMAYVFVAAGVYLLIFHIRRLQRENDESLTKLTENSRQLNVFKEVSLAMKQTLKLDKLLKTILTSVTAGHGLGFNRAIILLLDESGAKLHGILGTGPMTADEGFATWERLTKHRYGLSDLIEIKDQESQSDSELNNRVKRLEIPLTETHMLSKVLEGGTPLHIREIRPNERDPVLRQFAEEFNMNELALIPLINQGARVGILMIDNPVNHKPITPSGIDSVLPLANQAAIAILQTRLYSQAEDMAMKDGLTQLHNQRAFQNSLAENWPGLGEAPLSLIMLDIDYFKHFNERTVIY